VGGIDRLFNDKLKADSLNLEIKTQRERERERERGVV
jgi:hypothetical protein